MLRGAPRAFSARGKHSVLPERSPCSAVLPEHSLCSAVLPERSLCSACRPVPAGSGLWAVSGSKRVLRTSFGLERSLCSSPLSSSRGTFESPPKCDYKDRLRKDESCVVVENFASVCSSCVWLCFVVSALAPKFPATRILHRSKVTNFARWAPRGPSLTSLRVASEFGELRLVFVCLLPSDMRSAFGTKFSRSDSYLARAL